MISRVELEKRVPIRSEPLSVLMLTDALHEDAPGGSRRVVKELAEGLVTRGHRVTVLVPRWHGDEPACSERHGVRLLRYGAGQKGLRGLPGLVAEGRHALAALVHGAAAPFDILHVHFAYSHLPALLPYPRRLARATLRSFHGPWAVEGLAEQGRRPPRDGRYAIGSWARFQGRSLVERCSLAHSDHIMALSDYSIRQVMRMYGVRRGAVTLVPGGVDHERFVPPTAAKRDLRRRLGLPADGPMILTVRRLAARMGLDNLIAAMLAVREALVPEVHLVVVGQGQLRAHLESRVSALGLGGHVHFVGFLPDQALPLYYQAADLFVLPSRSLEGFGLVTLEAFSSGLPVVGTPAGATPELLAQVDERLILRGTSPDAIATGIVRYLTQMEGRIAPGTLRELVLSRYTSKTMVAQTEAVYERLLHETSRALVRLSGKQE